MINCPYCQNQEYLGAIFCSECGAQLVFAEERQNPDSRTDIYTQETVTEVHPDYSTAEDEIVPEFGWLTLHLVDQGEMLRLGDQEEITLGRASDDQPIAPDIDLGPYNAFEYGVSRLHASLKISGQEVRVTDLGSSNGTRVNGKRISPHEPCLILHGDTISLGKLKIQILVNR